MSITEDQSKEIAKRFVDKFPNCYKQNDTDIDWSVMGEGPDSLKNRVVDFLYIVQDVCRPCDARINDDKWSNHADYYKDKKEKYSDFIKFIKNNVVLFDSNKD